MPQPESSIAEEMWLDGISASMGRKTPGTGLVPSQGWQSGQVKMRNQLERLRRVRAERKGKRRAKAGVKTCTGGCQKSQNTQNHQQKNYSQKNHCEELRPPGVIYPCEKKLFGCCSWAQLCLRGVILWSSSSKPTPPINPEPQETE